MLFTASLPPALCDQLVRQGDARLYVLVDESLRALKALLQGRDTEFIVFDSKDDFIAGVDSDRPAESDWDHHATVFADPESGFLRHVSLLSDYDIL
jgi:hypothetical protein